VSEHHTHQRTVCIHHIKSQTGVQASNRQRWGRERWPLLVAAQGWGDPDCRPGKVREGTEDLPFPIYNATWYDNKALGCYNYINGERNGGNGEEGGGIRVGGAMCGAFFGGGNCYDDPVISTSSHKSGMCSGGGGCRGCGGCGGGSG
jgi:hypothetical protein